MQSKKRIVYTILFTADMICPFCTFSIISGHEKRKVFNVKKRGIIHIPLLYKLKYVYQQQPGHSIVGNYGYQVVDRGNERA